MLRELFRRILMLLPWIWVVLTLNFFLARLAPGSPFSDAGDPERSMHVTSSSTEEFKEKYGLNLPLHRQYFNYCKECVIHFSFGKAYRNPAQTILSTLCNSNVLLKTIEIAFLSLFLGIGLALLLGIFCALYPDSFWASAFHFIFGWIDAIPIYIFQPILIKFLVIKLRWFASGGWGDHTFGDFQHLFLPVMLQGLKYCADLMRYVQESFQEVLASDYIRTAYAKGLPFKTILLRHAFKPALISLVHIFSSSIRMSLLNSAYLERTFSIYGLGRAIHQLSDGYEYNLMMGMTFFLFFISQIIIWSADFIQHYCDPKAISWQAS